MLKVPFTIVFLLLIRIASLLLVAIIDIIYIIVIVVILANCIVIMMEYSCYRVKLLWGACPSSSVRSAEVASALKKAGRSSAFKVS